MYAYIYLGSALSLFELQDQPWGVGLARHLLPPLVPSLPCALSVPGWKPTQSSPDPANLPHIDGNRGFFCLPSISSPRQSNQIKSSFPLLPRVLGWKQAPLRLPFPSRPPRARSPSPWPLNGAPARARPVPPLPGPPRATFQAPGRRNATAGTESSPSAVARSVSISYARSELGVSFPALRCPSLRAPVRRAPRAADHGAAPELDAGGRPFHRLFGVRTLLPHPSALPGAARSCPAPCAMAPPPRLAVTGPPRSPLAPDDLAIARRLVAPVSKAPRRRGFGTAQPPPMSGRRLVHRGPVLRARPLSTGLWTRSVATWPARARHAHAMSPAGPTASYPLYFLLYIICSYFL